MSQQMQSNTSEQYEVTCTKGQGGYTCEPATVRQVGNTSPISSIQRRQQQQSSTQPISSIQQQQQLSSAQPISSIQQQLQQSVSQNGKPIDFVWNSSIQSIKSNIIYLLRKGVSNKNNLEALKKVFPKSFNNIDIKTLSAKLKTMGETTWGGKLSNNMLRNRESWSNILWESMVEAGLIDPNKRIRSVTENLNIMKDTIKNIQQKIRDWRDPIEIYKNNIEPKSTSGLHKSVWTILIKKLNDVQLSQLGGKRTRRRKPKRSRRKSKKRRNKRQKKSIKRRKRKRRKTRRRR